MALQAHRVHIVADQQSRIRRAMRIVARQAALKLHRRMFVDKRTRSLRMALRADCILRCTLLQQAVIKRSVRIMAVTALQNTLVHLVMKRLGKRRLYVGMTTRAKLRLRSLQ